MDSDMFVCGEIDDLILRQMARELVDKIPLTAAQYEVFGDQDVINMWLKQWDNQMDKHLDVTYNSCFILLMIIQE